MHYVNPLTGMPGSDVRHHVRRLFATKLAIRALESGCLTALVLEMPGHVTLHGETSATLGATERLPEAVRERPLRIGVPHPRLSIVIRQRSWHGPAAGFCLSNLLAAVLVLECLTRL